MNYPGHRPWVSGQVVASAASLARSLARFLARSLARSQVKPHKKTDQIRSRQLKHPTLPSTENSAQRTASNGGGTRNTTAEYG